MVAMRTLDGSCESAGIGQVDFVNLSRFGTDTADLLSWLADHGYAMRAWRHGAWERVSGVSPAHRNYLFTAKGPAGR
ncbi:hypothetical protein DP939_42655 [Spongiactinospora rosea]|uniref:Uncharacterized protein n=1 Tax=Spongiactinospora rosea TaxID=2248750 RepID=A0A366LKY5_9ACTN|nr:hypothetical protein DP939_42655 [Spongiactinospora rosea]